MARRGVSSFVQRREAKPHDDAAALEQARGEAKRSRAALGDVRKALERSRRRLGTSEPKRQTVRTKAQIHGRKRSKAARRARRRQR